MATVENSANEARSGITAGINPARGSFTTWSTALAIIIGSISALSVNTLPVLLTVLARTLNLDEAQSGYLAFVEMGGIAIGTVGCAMLPKLVHRLTWRWTAALGLVVVIAANGLSILAGSFYALLMARCMAGMGAGIAMAIVYAVLADGSGARALAIFNVAQLSSGGIAMAYLGPLAEQQGAPGLFTVMIVFAGLALFATSGLPRGHHAATELDHAAHQEVTGLGWLSVASVLFWFIGAGAIFAYLAFMGVAWGGAQEAVEASVSQAMFAGVAGGVTVALIGSRFGFKKPLYFAYMLFMVTIVALVVLKPAASFVIVASLFGYTWNLLTPYQFEAVTQIDSSSSAAMLVNASTLGGLAIGPAIAANMVTADYQQINGACLVAVVISLAILAIAVSMHEKQQA